MINKYWVIFLQKLKIGSAIAPIMVKLTGKHQDKIHPKHLIKLEAKEWYEPWVKKSDIVLDVGCGNGQRAIKLAGICSKVVGFDIESRNINLAKKEAKKLNINNVDFYQSNAGKKFIEKDSGFNVVFFCDVIEHLNNEAHVLSEIYRVLKKRGILLLIAPNIDTGWKKMQKNAGLSYFSDPDHKREYTKNELINKLKNSCFKVVYTGPVVYDTPLSGLIDVVGGFSLRLYKKLSLWKLNYAKSHPQESIGFRIAAQKI